MAVFSLEAAQALATDALLRVGCKSAIAQSVANALVAAEADGLKGHGLSRVPSYAQQVKVGKVDGKAVPSGLWVAPGLLRIDVAHGFAYPALDLAIAELPRITRVQGIAAASLYRSHHCGAAGLIVEALAEAGLVALLFANTPAAMASAGGRKALLGTNPIAFASPRAGAEPLVIDLSLSTAARGKILAAKQKGDRLPEGWARDRHGHATTDPDEALAGTMEPMGGSKGAVLALMVEILAGALTGGRFASEASSFLDDQGAPPATGQLIITLDVSRLWPEGTARVAALAQLIMDDQPARLPGARRLAARQKAAREGLDLDERLVVAIRGI